MPKPFDVLNLLSSAAMMARKSAVIIAAGLFLLTVAVASQQNKAPATKDQAIEPKKQPSLSSPPNNVTANYAEQPKDEPPKWFKRPEWWLLIVAAGTGWAVFYQAREMKDATAVMRGQLTAMQGQLEQMKGSGEQTNKLIDHAQTQAEALLAAAEIASDQTKALLISAQASMKAADAAKASSDIAAALTIPTLVVETFELGETEATNMTDFLTYPQINIVVKNCGQTPAFLRSWTIIFTCENLPAIPVYRDGMVLEKVIVEPNTSYALPKLFFPHRQTLAIEDVQAVIDRQKELNVYGYITYGDLFGNPLRRLKFCETALNLFDGPDPMIQWFDFGHAEYTGTEYLPRRKPIVEDHQPTGGN